MIFRTLAVLFLVMQGLVMALPTATMAQAPTSAAPQNVYPNPVVTLPAASLKDFDTVLPEIARQGHVALVCEAQPLHLTLTPNQAADFARTLAPSGMPLEETIRQVAAAYDYDAQRLSADTFLLTKRFTDLNDLPDVTFEEALNSLQSILDATHNYRPTLRPDQSLLNLLQSATPDQKIRLAQGIPMSQLSDDWRQTAWQFAISHKLHGLSGLARVTQRLKACQEQDTFFCYRQYLNLTYTAYQGPFAVNGLTDLFALNGWLDTGTGGATGFDESPGVHLVGDKIIVSPGVKDPTAPDGPVLPVPTSRLRLTLDALAKQLSDRPTAGGAHAAPVRVDPALARKTLCLAGSDFASPDSLLQAVCAMYGLERHDGYTTNTVTITPPRPKVLADTSEIKAEVTRLLPAAFLRAVRARGAQNTFLQTAGSDYSTARGDALFVASVRRLRGIVEPALNKRADHQLPVPDAGDEARDLVGLSSLAKCIQDIQSLAVPAASYIDNFDSTTFTLAQNGGDPNSFVYGFAYQGSNGQTSGAVGKIGYPQGTFGYGTGSGIKIKVGSVTLGM